VSDGVAASVERPHLEAAIALVGDDGDRRCAIGRLELRDLLARARQGDVLEG
jgi:hypothetical protein